MVLSPYLPAWKWSSSCHPPKAARCGQEAAWQKLEIAGSFGLFASANMSRVPSSPLGNLGSSQMRKIPLDFKSYRRHLELHVMLLLKHVPSQWPSARSTGCRCTFFSSNLAQVIAKLPCYVHSECGSPSKTFRSADPGLTGRAHSEASASRPPTVISSNPPHPLIRCQTPLHPTAPLHPSQFVDVLPVASPPSAPSLFSMFVSLLACIHALPPYTPHPPLTCCHPISPTSPNNCSPIDPLPNPSHPSPPPHLQFLPSICPSVALHGFCVPRPCNCQQTCKRTMKWGAGWGLVTSQHNDTPLPLLSTPPNSFPSICPSFARHCGILQDHCLHKKLSTGRALLCLDLASWPGLPQKLTLLDASHPHLCTTSVTLNKATKSV